MVPSIYIPGTTPHCLVITEGNVNFLGTRNLVYSNALDHTAIKELTFTAGRGVAVYLIVEPQIDCGNQRSIFHSHGFQPAHTSRCSKVKSVTVRVGLA